MSDKLIDAAKDKWAIIEERPDASALRNDGQKLRSRHKNPWYVLATLHGEQGKRIDRDLAARNRRAWNLWSCQGLEAAARTALAEKLGLGEDELGGAWEDERSEIERRFRERMGEGVDLPDPKIGADLREIHFARHIGVSFAKFHFASRADFAAADFADFADFSSAQFADFAAFSSAHFASRADFSSAHFANHADFASVHFASHVGFRSAYLAGSADFASADFTHGANFSFAYLAAVDFFGVRFAHRADFTSTHFANIADFSSAVFKRATRFDDAIFATRAPKFFAAEVYQDTTFTLDDQNWPQPEAKSAPREVDAYVRLKQLMTDAHKPEDAHFFMRRELRCKLLTEKKREQIWIWIYWKLSDFGYSIWRPFLGLAALVFVFWLIYLVSFIWEAVLHNGARTWPEAFGLSFSNTFGFLGFNRIYFGAEYFQELPAWIKVAGAVQTIMGIIFLFFLGLGLRNRFRLK